VSGWGVCVCGGGADLEGVRFGGWVGGKQVCMRMVCVSWF